MSRSGCCVPYCDTGRRATPKRNNGLGKNPSMFRVPSNLELLEKWERAIKRADKRLTSNDRVCQSHFEKEFIVTHDQIMLKNGDVFVSEREKPRLKEGAVPSIFPITPLYVTDKIKKRKFSTLRYPLEINPITFEKKMGSQENIINDDYTNVSEVTVQQLHHTVDKNPTPVWIKEEKDDSNESANTTTIENFSDLLNERSKIEFPDSRWTSAIIENNIVITYWNASFECLKRIVVDHNLKIKAYIKEVSVVMDETVVHNLDTLKNVVKKLHELNAHTVP